MKTKFQRHGHIRKTQDKKEQMMAKTKMQIHSAPVRPTTFDSLSEYSYHKYDQSRPSNSRRWEKRERKRAVRTWNKRESIRLLNQAEVDERLDAAEEELARELSGFYDDMYPNEDDRYWDDEYYYDNHVYDGVDYGNEAYWADDYRYAMDRENDYYYDDYYEDEYHDDRCECCGRLF